MTERYDAIVVGGGPSGSTAGNLLARGGARVLLIEREVFPRFHIGESLLPANLRVFDRLGYHPVSDEHIEKAGAEFFEEPEGEASRHATYLFADSLGGVATHAYQVDRATFDLHLLEAADRAGAEIHQGERVTDIELEASAQGPTVRTDKGRYHARYVLDATGLDAFLAYKHESRRRLEQFGLGAIFRHYELAPRVWEELVAAGNIRVVFVPDGWIWAIPLGAGRMSVGLVTRRKGLKDAWLDEAVAESAEMRRILDGARVEGPTRKLASFSFVNDRPHGARWSCIGDAAAFLDPMFSSGVNLGMTSSAKAVDLLLPALEAGAEADPGLMDAHAAGMKRGYDVFATLINAIYQRRLLPDLFFAREQDMQLRRGMTSVLAGDVWREDNPFTEMLWRSRLRFTLDAA